MEIDLPGMLNASELTETRSALVMSATLSPHRSPNSLVTQLPSSVKVDPTLSRFITSSKSQENGLNIRLSTYYRKYLPGPPETYSFFCQAWGKSTVPIKPSVLVRGPTTSNCIAFMVTCHPKIRMLFCNRRNSVVSFFQRTLLRLSDNQA